VIHHSNFSSKTDGGKSGFEMKTPVVLEIWRANRRCRKVSIRACKPRFEANKVSATENGLDIF